MEETLARSCVRVTIARSWFRQAMTVNLGHPTQFVWLCLLEPQTVTLCAIEKLLT